jgi:hypothetical protein
MLFLGEVAGFGDAYILPAACHALVLLPIFGLFVRLAEANSFLRAAVTYKDSIQPVRQRLFRSSPEPHCWTRVT